MHRSDTVVQRERQAFRTIVVVAAFVPVSGGLAGVLLGTSFPGFDPESATSDIDSHFRYLSGLLLGIGLAFWITVASVPVKIRQFQLLCAIVIIGGLARLSSIGVMGWPSAPHLLALVMELIVTPTLLAWTRRAQTFR